MKNRETQERLIRFQKKANDLQLISNKALMIKIIAQFHYSCLDFN